MSEVNVIVIEGGHDDEHGYCAKLVQYSDYAALESRNAELEAKLAALTEESERSIREAKDGYRAEIERGIAIEAKLANSVVALNALSAQSVEYVDRCAALLRRIDELETRLAQADVLAQRVASAPAAKVEYWSSGATWVLHKIDHVGIYEPLSGKRVALVLLEDHERIVL